MQDLIAAVYASKEKYDRNCTAQRLPSQTLARHLDDFLVHRFVLRISFCGPVLSSFPAHTSKTSVQCRMCFYSECAQALLYCAGV